MIMNKNSVLPSKYRLRTLFIIPVAFCLTFLLSYNVGLMYRDKTGITEYFKENKVLNRSIQRKELVAKFGRPTCHILKKGTVFKEDPIDKKIDHFQLHQEPIPFLKEFANPCWKNSEYDAVLNITSDRTLYDEDSLEKKSTRKDIIHCLPLVYLAGFNKCGTTDLYRSITQHPDLLGSHGVKEIRYWNQLRYYDLENEHMGQMRREIKKTRKCYKNSNQTALDYIPLRHYVDYLQPVAESIVKSLQKIKTQRITIDSSPSYSWLFDGWRKLPGNQNQSEPRYNIANIIKEVVPMAKIIFIVRDPISRLWSGYNYRNWDTKKSPELFHELVMKSIFLWNECLQSHSLRYCMFDGTTDIKKTNMIRQSLRAGLYKLYITDWIETFGRENVLILRLEDYALDRKGMAEKVFQFLNLRSLADEEWREYNDTLHDTEVNFEMFRKTRNALRDFYAPYNKQLSDYLNDTRFNYSDQLAQID